MATSMNASLMDLWEAKKPAWPRQLYGHLEEEELWKDTSSRSTRSGTAVTPLEPQTRVETPSLA